jgi:hypothetical protein
LRKIKHKKIPPTRRDFAWYKTHFSKIRPLRGNI